MVFPEPTEVGLVTIRKNFKFQRRPKLFKFYELTNSIPADFDNVCRIAKPWLLLEIEILRPGILELKECCRR